MSKLKLTKIEVTTKDGKKIELSLDEAKDLHEQLHELFGEKKFFLPSAPVVIEPPYVTCSAQSGLSVAYQGEQV